MTYNALDCRSHYIDNSPALGWAESTVNRDGGEGGGGGLALWPDFLSKPVKMYIKASLIHVLYEIWTDLQDISE
jgi:hypothetical protein